MHRRYKAAAGVLAAAMMAGSVMGWAQAQPAQQASQPSASASGEVRRVDADAGKVTIKHGEIAALELPAMTLVYRAEPVLLIDIRPGDTVRFTATRQDGVYVVTEISN